MVHTPVTGKEAPQQWVKQLPTWEGKPLFFITQPQTKPSGTAYNLHMQLLFVVNTSSKPANQAKHSLYTMITSHCVLVSLLCIPTNFIKKSPHINEKRGVVILHEPCSVGRS